MSMLGGLEMYSPGVVTIANNTAHSELVEGNELGKYAPRLPAHAVSLSNHEREVCALLLRRRRLAINRWASSQ